MTDKQANGNACAPTDEVIADLTEADLLSLAPGERLWKLYCFRVVGHATGLRHRIYTKIKPDGRLGLVTFAVHNPRPATGVQGNGDGAPWAVRSGIARVADLSVHDLDHVVGAIRSRVQESVETCEELDLSGFESLGSQIEHLRARAG